MILKIHITLILALLYNLFIAKKKIYLIAYLFIIMHELSHMITALLLNIDICEIVLLPFGATAKYNGKITQLKEFLISISGPIATFIFALIYNNTTYFHVNLLILMFNFIPIYPLDGGRILRTVLLLLFGKKNGKKINHYLSNFFMALLVFFSIYLNLKYKNFSLILISLYVFKIHLDEYKKEKILSKINYLQI